MFCKKSAIFFATFYTIIWCIYTILWCQTHNYSRFYFRLASQTTKQAIKIMMVIKPNIGTVLPSTTELISIVLPLVIKKKSRSATTLPRPLKKV